MPTFKTFNTNNLWINLKGLLPLSGMMPSSIIYSQALKKVMTDGGMDLDIIVNPKVTDDGHSVIQVRIVHDSVQKLS